MFLKNIKIEKTRGLSGPRPSCICRPYLSSAQPSPCKAGVWLVSVGPHVSHGRSGVGYSVSSDTRDLISDEMLSFLTRDSRRASLPF